MVRTGVPKLVVIGLSYVYLTLCLPCAVNGDAIIVFYSLALSPPFMCKQLTFRRNKSGLWCAPLVEKTGMATIYIYPTRRTGLSQEHQAGTRSRDRCLEPGRGSMSVRFVGVNTCEPPIS